MRNAILVELTRYLCPPTLLLSVELATVRTERAALGAWRTGKIRPSSSAVDVRLGKVARSQSERGFTYSALAQFSFHKHLAWGMMALVCPRDLDNLLCAQSLMDC